MVLAFCTPSRRLTLEDYVTILAQSPHNSTKAGDVANCMLSVDGGKENEPADRGFLSVSHLSLRMQLIRPSRHIFH